MKGNKDIAGILKERQVSPDMFQDLTYTITKFDGIERTRIDMKGGCPIFCLCDGYYMSWYGDYGSMGFDCSWKTSIENLPYQSPHYMYEKMDLLSRTPGRFKEFDCNLCKKELLDSIRESSGFEDLNEIEQDQVMSYITDNSAYWVPDSLKDYEEELEELHNCYHAACEDEYAWVDAVRKLSDENSFLCCETYDMYNFGMQVPTYFFIVFYVLSIVRDMIQEDKSKNESTEELVEC